MGFWTVIFLISAMAIATEFVLRLVKMGTRHYENIERIKRGYPTVDGAMPHGSEDTMHGEHTHAYVHGERLQ